MDQHTGHHHHHHSLSSQLERGKVMLEAGNFEAAYRELSVAVHMVEDHDASSDISDEALAELYFLRASALTSPPETKAFQEPDLFHQVLDDVDEAMIAQPQNATYRIAKARLYKRCEFANYLQEAREELEGLLEQVPALQEALLELGDVLVRMEQFRDALPLLAQMISQTDQPPLQAYLLRGLCHFKNIPPNFEAAAKDFYQAQLLDASSEVLYLWRSQCFQEMGNWKDALREYDLLLSFVSDNAGYFVDRGFMRDSMGDEDGALEDYNRALDLGDHPLAYNNRAMHHLKAGRFEAAIHDAKAALKTDPSTGIAYATLAEIYAAMEDRTELYHNLKLAMETYYEDTVEVLMEPAFQPYHDDPDFLAVIGKGEE